MKLSKIVLLSPFILVGCVSTTQVYKEAALLDYPQKPKSENVLTYADAFIRSTLKDPDSLKNLNITKSYKCYASKMGMSDNLSPKFDYGHWCFFMSYGAKNSYGGFVRGSEEVVYTKTGFKTVNQVGETLRKSDDVYTYSFPTN